MRILLVLPILLLSGCTAAVNLDAAEDSNNPACAEVMIRLPAILGEHEQRFTNSQATSAWGDPAAILLRCGLPAVTVSELPCVTAADFDWLVDDSQAPSYRFISYATSPAVEVIVDSQTASGVTTLEALESSLSLLNQTKRCTAITN
jgi:Iap family predicted aminopeptidase